MGSSSSSRSGWDSSSRASATRRRSPPESVVTSASLGRAAQRVHRLVEHRIELPGAGRVDLVLQARELVGGLVGVVHRQLVEAVEQVAHVAHAVLDVAAHVLGLVQVRLLLEEADGRTGCELSLAAVVLVDPRHDPQQGGLARAVETEDADLGAGVEAEVDVLEDRLVRRVGPAQLVHRVDVLARHRVPEHRSGWGTRPLGEPGRRILGPSAGATFATSGRLLAA